MAPPKGFEDINELCGSIANLYPLSVFTAVYSGLLLVCTVPLNYLLLYSILHGRTRGCLNLFYKLILNIASADLLTGLIGDTASVYFHIKEAQGKEISPSELHLLHLTLFIFDAVALTTLTLLSIDRLVALLLPIKYHTGIGHNGARWIVGLVWPFSFLSAAPYFKIYFIRQLALFSSLSILFAVVSLVVTLVIYRRRTLRRIKTHRRQSVDMSSDSRQNCASLPAVIRTQKKATRSFVVMLCVFVVTYLPTCFTAVYMNSCTIEKNCAFVHVLRDVSILSILSSSVLRPLTFLLSVKHLRTTAKHIFLPRNTKNNTMRGVQVHPNRSY